MDLVPAPPGGEEPPDDGAAVGDTLVVDEIALEFLPYAAGRLQVDEAWDGTWWITDMLTKESKMIPPQITVPVLYVREDGSRAALTCAATDEAVAVDEVMVRQVFLSKGMMVIVEERDQGDVQFELEDYWSRHREATVDVAAASLGVELHFHLSVFVRERGGGCRGFWAMSTLYDLMKLDQYKKTASKWVYNCVDSWCQSLKGFGNDHIIQGQTVKRANVLLSQKCVAATSASSIAVVALLAIFAGRSHRAGGFKDSAQQARAQRRCSSHWSKMRTRRWGTTMPSTWCSTRRGHPHILDLKKRRTICA